MRLWLILAMMLSSVAVLGIMLLGHAQFRRFQRSLPALRNSDDLSQFKKLAAAQMYESLVSLTLTAAPLVIWVFGKFIAGHLGWLDLLVFVIAPVLILGFASDKMRGTAEAVRQIAVADQSLASERDQVVDVWLHRLLPNW
jgi:hypothetical protein